VELAFLARFYFDSRMKIDALKWLLLISLAAMQVGCATATESSDDSPPDLTPAPSQDDSHGWGTSIQGGSH
jgi:hypothetical protein